MLLILDVVIPPAYISSAGSKKQLCTANNATKWIRYKKTKIKNEFKNILKDWYIVPSERMYDFIEVHFTALRKTRKKLDSDAMSISAYKWTLDLLVELGYIQDDDQVRIVLHPTKLKQDIGADTLIHMIVYERSKHE